MAGLLPGHAARAASPALIDPATSGDRPDVGPHARLIEREGGPRLDVRLLRRTGSPDAVGRVGVLFDLAPGWHVYWRSAGDTGLPPELTWSLPNGQVGPTRWPAPRAFVGADSDPDAASYGYEGRVLLFSETSGDPTAVRVAVEGDVLVCENECVPASFQLERGPGERLRGLSADDEAALFETFEGLVPRTAQAHGLTLAAAWSQSGVRPGDDFEGAIEISCVGAADSECASLAPLDAPGPGGILFPDDSDSLTLRDRSVQAVPEDPGRFRIELQGSAEPDEAVDAHISGLLSLARPNGERVFVELELPFPAAEAGAPVAMLGRHWDPEAAAMQPTAATAGASPVALPLLRALALALLGGLLLNLMPCVLPVLAIKIFSISELAEAAHTSRSEPVRHGLAYTAGILGSMAALGFVVLALRAAGRSVGWGFQFQEPVYIAGISAVLVAFALNLFGAFEIRGGAGPLADLGQQATGARRSFFEGLLAVALATPCSAPFLGTAVGFAFASPPVVILGVFLAIGLGLAAPFLLVSLVPAWARFVPRSGAWMHTVRCGLGFALLATVLWLLWLFSGSAGGTGVVSLLAFLLALAFALWCFGLLQRGTHPRATLVAGIGVVALCVAGLNAVSARVSADPAPATELEAAVDANPLWQPWSADVVASRLADGRPVFVRFTADWCITCKLNERVALADETVLQAFERADFALLVADWTKRDEAIRQELARHGRAGVPAYLVYHPDRPAEPRLLPELLSASLLLETIAGIDREPDRSLGDEDHPGALEVASSRQPERDDE